MATDKLQIMPTALAVNNAEHRVEFAFGDVVNSSVFLFWHCMISCFLLAFQFIEGQELWATGCYLVFGMLSSVFVRVLFENLAQNWKISRLRNVTDHMEFLQLSLVLIAFGLALNAEMQAPHWLSTSWLAVGVIGCFYLLRAYARLRAARRNLQHRRFDHRIAIDSLMDKLIYHSSEK